MFLTDKLAKKIMADPKVQFQMTLGIIDNLANNLVNATNEVISNKYSLDEYESKLYALKTSVESAYQLVLDELERGLDNE